MENLTKAKMNIREGTLELEGSEQFVEKYLNIFVEGTLRKWKIEEDKEIKTDTDIINLGMDKSARVKGKMLRQIIRELQDEYKGAASLEDIKLKAEESGIKKDAVEGLIQKLKCAGEIIETSGDRFRVV